jgi:DNA-binding response OmpR family regulator
MARVLVVDDSPLVRAILCDCLRDLGHEAYPAASARQAVFLCRMHRPDLVIKDLLMKDTDLLGLMNQLRLAKKQLPIVVCTTRTHREELVAAMRAGADDFLVKPFAPSEVASVIQRLTAAQ